MIDTNAYPDASQKQFIHNIYTTKVFSEMAHDSYRVRTGEKGNPGQDDK